MLLTLSLSACLGSPTNNNNQEDDSINNQDNNNENNDNENTNDNNGNENGNENSNTNDDNGNSNQTNEHEDDNNENVSNGTINNPFTIKQACDLAKTLASDAQTSMKYFIKGYISGTPNMSSVTDYGNATFDLKDKTGTDTFKCFQVYYLNNKKFTSSDSLKEGDEIVIFSAIVNYRGNTPETTSKGSAYVYSHNTKVSSTIPEQGFPQPDSSATVTTISALKSANSSWKTEGANNSKLYRITGIAQWAVNANYGNFDIVDSTGNIYVHGCTGTKQSLVKDGTNGLVINNDRSFSGTGLKAGDEVTIEGWYSYHKYTNSYGVPQFTGYITNITAKNASTITARNYDASVETYSGSYYSSVSGKSGSDLLLGLHNLMDSTHTSWTSYKGLYSGYSAIKENKCFYAGTSLSGEGNREHVWPQSISGSSSTQLYGEDHGGSDFHHVRHADSTNNSRRGNSMFGPVYGNGGYFTMPYTSGGTNKYTSNVFEPADNIKGDCARIIMYMYMHYSNATTANNLTGWADRSYYGEMHVNWVMGTQTVNDSFKLLRLWNALDPVSEEEKARNEQGYKMQGNRNPFIDHPSYADAIWG